MSDKKSSENSSLHEISFHKSPEDLNIVYGDNEDVIKLIDVNGLNSGVNLVVGNSNSIEEDEDGSKINELRGR